MKARWFSSLFAWLSVYQSIESWKNDIFFIPILQSTISDWIFFWFFWIWWWDFLIFNSSWKIMKNFSWYESDTLETYGFIFFIYIWMLILMFLVSEKYFLLVFYIWNWTWLMLFKCIFQVFFDFFVFLLWIYRCAKSVEENDVRFCTFAFAGTYPRMLRIRIQEKLHKLMFLYRHIYIK